MGKTGLQLRIRIVHVILIVVSVIWLLPTFGLLVQSFRNASDISASGWWTAIANPSSLTLEPYKGILNDPAIVQAFGNTFLITVPATLLVLTLASLAGYGFACLRFRGRHGLLLLIVALLVVPIQVALIPIAQLYNLIGVFGSIVGVVFFHAAFGLPFGVFLLRNIFLTVPYELVESAKADGARHSTIFARVILPLGLPGLASLSIFQFVWVWNDLLIALVYASADSAPLTAYIQQQMRNFGTNVDIIAPGAFVQMVVPIIVFLLFQPYFVRGIMAGSMKG